MREGLLASIGKAATVRFECGAADVRPNGSGGATILGSDGAVLGEYDIVIDACGVASPLRKHRIPGTEIKDWYTGLTLVGGMIKDPETELDPELVRRLGQGTLMIAGDKYDGNGGIVMLLQRFGAEEKDHRATFYLQVPRAGPKDLANELGVNHSTRASMDADQKETVDKIKIWMKTELGARWEPMYKQCVDAMYNVAVRPLFMFPPNILPTQDSPLPLICVGDALHGMPPFTGSGGNLALEDARDLSDFLVAFALGKEKRELLPGLREVELKFFNRAAKVVTGVGEVVRDALVRELNSKEFCQHYTLASLFKGPGSWSFLWLLCYIFALFYMWVHKLTDYGMAAKPKKAKSL
jgi:2-polyprenyl-6-methoxyphenol hydroxylase-like FAD-dependent oxidoreductase